MKRLAFASAILVGLIAGCARASDATPTPASTATATPSPAASVAPATLQYTWPAKLEAGTYRTTFVWDTPFAVTFAVPAGWESRDVEVFTDPVSRVNEVGGSRGRSVMFARVDNVFTDPCQRTLADPAVADTVDALATALSDLPGVDAKDPVPVSLAGYEGSYLELAVRPDAGCELRQFGMWTSRREWTKPSRHAFLPEFFAERERYRIWVLDVDGARYLVAALSAADATPADLAELQGVIDSITIGT